MGSRTFKIGGQAVRFLNWPKPVAASPPSEESGLMVGAFLAGLSGTSSERVAAIRVGPGGIRVLRRTPRTCPQGHHVILFDLFGVRATEAHLAAGVSPAHQQDTLRRLIDALARNDMDEVRRQAAMIVSGVCMLAM